MDQAIHPRAVVQMRQAIAAASGNEVFFLGRTDSTLCLVEAEVLARGNAEAVPAILQSCRFGDVVVHNHPGGLLQPSAADLEIAGRLGALGVAFYIVDNSVESVYKVVEPFAPRDEQLLEPQRIAALLGPDGEVAVKLPGYEERPEQLRMALAVGEAFNLGRLSLIEAGTGTGKSLAYLVPALLWALANEERVVVSTNTINLQEQLIRKDLPFLRRATGLQFRAVLVKGRSNYLCRRRTETAHREPGLFDDELSAEFHSLLVWARQTADGSREELNFIPRSQVWDEVCCEADQCARVRCALYGDCFFHKARRQAAQADLLVVNHALLLSDLALRQQTDNYTAAAVLPPFDRVIVDEAHHLEDVATRYFSTQVTRFAFARVLNRLRHPRKAEMGLLPRFLARLSEDLPDTEEALYRRLHEAVEGLLLGRQQLYDRAVATLEDIGRGLADHLGREPAEAEELKQRLVPDLTDSPFWQETADAVRHLSRETQGLAGELAELLKACEALPETVAAKLTSPLTDLRGLVCRLGGLVADLDGFIARDADCCGWFEVGLGRIGRGRGLVTRLCTAPLEVAERLRKALYERFRTVVMTSATLTVAGSFGYFQNRVGLDRAEPGRLAQLLLPSPFDFARQALLAVPTDVPEPGRSGYGEMVRDLCEQAILAAGGRSFVLFTAYSLLRRVYGELAPVLEARGYRCLRQGEENRHQLLKTFAADPASVLFGTDSFWEGVDVPGRALEQVILTRLPFKVPSDPVLEARAEAIEKAGGDPFMSYTVPQAAIRFKQGFGRLIRHRKDRGVVLILDSRVVKKGYGRVFLRSLPDVPVITGTSVEVLSGMAEFLDQTPGTE